MTTNEILANLRENGGFNNFRNWNEKEVAEWVMANYDCSYSVSRNVAKYIK